VATVEVFSTYVEVFLYAIQAKSAGECLLHVRGGVSAQAGRGGGTVRSSPRTWRCFLLKCRGISPLISLLHARGGVSKIIPMLFTEITSSPRTWRCFRDDYIRIRDEYVFSTHVEVFPRFDISAYSS